MPPQERRLTLERYRQRTKLFSRVAARRTELASETPARAASLLAAQINGSELSWRELDVLALIAQGCSNSEIGEQLALSPETIKTHVRRIIARLNARNRAHAVAIGIALGSITPAGQAATP
jgi:ATP/maltotriose-dependent transcriptional regulator MalT